MESSELALRRSKREHQPSTKAAVSSTSFPVASASPRTSRRSQRRRVPASASPASTLRGTETSFASPRLVSVAVDAVGPNGQRRSFRAAAHTTSTFNSVPQHRVPLTYPTTGVHDDTKVLGRYSSHDCLVVCEVILSQLEEQTLMSTVLDEDKSPAFIQWTSVAKKIETMHRLMMTPRECQVLWKFLAYGQNVSMYDANNETLLPDSDEEEFYQSPQEINTRLAADRVKAAEIKDESIAASDGTRSEENQDKRGAATEEIAAKSCNKCQQNKVHEVEKSEKSGTLDTLEKDRETPAIRLYPTYSLPTGVPDAWYRPFGPKDALPLTFVASRFLRRKPTPLPAQSRFEKSAVALGPSGAGTTDLKRKQAEPANNAEAAKKSKLVTLPVSTFPCAYKRPSTPSPTATRARSELDFFQLRLREEQARKQPGATFELSPADVQRRFGEASAEVRRQCRTLAAYDIERFNQESLRMHTQQKATGSDNTKAEPRLALTPSSASKLATLPSLASNTELVSTASAENTAASLTKAPGSTAALLAHVAVVSATAAKTKSSASPMNVSSVANSVRVQKEDEHSQC